MTETHPFDAAERALREAKVLAGLLSESILAEGFGLMSPDTAERHAVLGLKVVEAIEASRSALAKLSKLKIAAQAEMQKGRRATGSAPLHP